MKQETVKWRSLPSLSSALTRLTWATNVPTPRSTAHHGLVALCERAQLFTLPSFAKLAPCVVPNWSVYSLTWYDRLFSATLKRTTSVTVQNNILDNPENNETSSFTSSNKLVRYSPIDGSTPSRYTSSPSSSHNSSRCSSNLYLTKQDNNHVDRAIQTEGILLH